MVPMKSAQIVLAAVPAACSVDIPIDASCRHELIEPVTIASQVFATVLANQVDGGSVDGLIEVFLSLSVSDSMDLTS